ncbi:MAG: hypothetical protein EZS28_022640 [Streblomastix strix]|uniref:Guanine nucleotide-binding protein-like 3 N-terminal domain-containing protein n=1 Tax=Streblomastix strix TaxID=222440 RepID=A0A5J4VHN1_9EUKA|nr:MAG: hypothetical protein EZS28_022640 [Streblomastix strix]
MAKLNPVKKGQRKDPPIPNACPFKDKLLEQAERLRQQMKEDKEEERIESRKSRILAERRKATSVKQSQIIKQDNVSQKIIQTNNNGNEKVNEKSNRKKRKNSESGDN